MNTLFPRMGMLMLSLLTWISSPLQAQTGLQDSLKARFDLLEPYVHTGFLYDRLLLANVRDAGYSAHPSNFNGNSNSSICSYSTYYQLVDDFRESAYDSALLPSYLALKDLEYSAHSSFDVPISILQLDFQRIDTLAADEGWLSFDTATFKFIPVSDSTRIYDSIFDANGVLLGIIDTTFYNNPDSLAALALPTYKLFAASTLPNTAGIPNLQTPLVFGLSDSLYFTNMPGLIGLKIDLADGAGWQTLIPGQPISALYGSYGLKTIKIKFELQNWSGEMPVAYTKILVFPTAPPPDDAFFSTELNVTAPCAGLTDGGFGMGIARVSIRYADPTIKKLTKPFILVEGFDSYLRKTGNDYNAYDPGTKGYGRLAWNGFMSGRFFNDNGDSIYKQLKQSPLLMDSLQGRGYDIILVDFKSSLLGIEMNANTLIHIIRWVNQEKTTDEELVVVGGSMGGLIARYALRKMELEECCHETRLYGTFDTPHKGANIPLGVQEWVYNARTNFLSKAAKRQYDDVLTSRSASQMLVYHRDSSCQYLFTAMQEVLDSLGHPEDCFRMAISNGNGKGIGLNFGAATEILKYEFDINAPVLVTAVNPYSKSISIKDSLSLLQNNAYAIANSPFATSNQIILKTKPLAGTAFNYGLMEGLAWLNRFIIKKMKETKFTADAMFPAGNLGTLLSYQLSNAVVSAAFSTILVGVKDNNNLYLNSNVYLDRPTLPIDYCPGSTTGTMGEIAGNQSIKLGQFGNEPIELGIGEVIAQHSHHTFIPTSSSIDIESAFLMMPMDSITDYYPILSNFNSIFFPLNDPFRHEEHVEIGVANRAYCLSTLESSKSVQPNSLAVPLTPFFNFGNKNHYALKSIQVHQGAILGVNLNQGTDFGLGPFPDLFAHFSLKTALCGSHVEILPDGQFILGENNYTPSGSGILNNSADVIFRRNGVLEIYAGGKLIVNQNSRLIIEHGATLILHPGAEIVLNGDDAVLDLQGNVELIQDAVFTFSGTGHVRYAMDHTPGAEWINHGGNAFVLRGAHTQDLVLDIVSEPVLSNFDQVTIARGKAQFTENVALQIHSPVRLDTAFFAPIDTISLAAGPGAFGVLLHGAQNQFVRNSRFIGAQFGLANNGLQGYGVTVENSTFAKNGTGLRLEGPGGIVEGCVFENNAIGMDANNITLEVKALASSFTNNSAHGISFVGSDGNATIYMQDCYAAFNGSDGFNGKTGTVTSSCSEFVQNGITGMLIDRCRVNLRGTYISNNLNGFDGFGLALFNINNGYNTIRNNTSDDVLASFDATYSQLFSTSFKALANDFGPNVSIAKVNGAPLSLVVSGPTSPSGLLTYAAVYCANSLPYNGLPFDGLASGLDPVGTGNNGCDTCRFYVGSPVYSALEDIYSRLAARDPSTLLEDIYRADEIVHVFEGKTLGASDQLLRDYALFAEMQALSAAFSEGLIEAGADAEYTPLVLSRLQAVTFDTTASGMERRFGNRIGQALMMRLNHQYTDALALLNNHAAFAGTPAQTNQALYWACALEGEADLVNGSLSFDEFLLWNATCSQTYGMRGARQDLPPSRVVVQDGGFGMTAYPNPASDLTWLTFTEPLEGTLDVIDLTGRTVVGPLVVKGQAQVPVPLNLPPGLYTLRVHTPLRGTATARIVVH